MRIGKLLGKYNLNIGRSIEMCQTSSSLSLNLNANELLQTRFVLVVLIGGSLALFATIGNAFLARLFVSRLNFRHSPYFFLGFVALFDTLVDSVYILLLIPPLLSEFFILDRLYLYWLPQAHWLYLCGQIFKTSSCYCLIVASFERFSMTRHWTFSGFEYRWRWVILVVAICFAVLVKLWTVEEIVIVMNSSCSRIFQRYIPTFAQQKHGHKRQWVRNSVSLLSVMLPFLTLIVLNGGIVLMLRRQNIQQLRSLITELTMGHDVMKIRRRNIRNATHTLLLIISAYLISNLLNQFLSVTEYFHPGFIQRNYPYQYRIASDCSSLFTVIGNALRVPAHIYSNREIRQQLRLMICALCSTNPEKVKKESLISTSLTVRRQSELIDNPWFSALLTTPRKETLKASSFNYSLKRPNGGSNSLEYCNNAPNAPLILSGGRTSLSEFNSLKRNRNVGARLAQSNLMNPQPRNLEKFYATQSLRSKKIQKDLSNKIVNPFSPDNTNSTINNKIPKINNKEFENNNKYNYRSGYASKQSKRRHTLANTRQMNKEEYNATEIPLKYIENRYDNDEIGYFYHDDTNSASTISYVDDDDIETARISEIDKLNRSYETLRL